LSCGTRQLFGFLFLPDTVKQKGPWVNKAANKPAWELAREQAEISVPLHHSCGMQQPSLAVCPKYKHPQQAEGRGTSRGRLHH